MDTKEYLLELFSKRLEMISKILKYDLKNYEKEIIVRDLSEIIHTLDDERDLRKQWLK